MIVHGNEPITLVGGGSVAESGLRAALRHAPRVVAADSGADAALAAGVVPEAVIGDLDSLSNEARARIPGERVHRIAEQDSTDFDKALRNIEAPLVIGVGFLGKRLDHQLAACNTLVRYPGKRAVLTSEDSLVLLSPPNFALDLARGVTVSLFPMGAVEGVSEGLEWPIDGLNFAPDGMIGTSNRATGAIQLGFTAPKMLLSLPSDCLDGVVASLGRSAARW
ncbi:thiamine diphosphokinase [Roseovarius sp. SCSIO 43702]|uniref:thiamine diphosphokinase n=1 Tax=Roseovarius sp. SCSIO 43702 TaxID=2823043 RepID=UPI001C739777|nr:thiamine diphosphokinase [Roseovarius sp. SCSIO 43702]QYX55724.1 thiamine diphosphokinase [Roseovarius sp. SCSIO 43702]